MSTDPSMSQDSLCPCDSGRPYAQCCKPCLDNPHTVKTAEQLMRSRYTAYTTNNEDYLLATWHASTRPDCLDLEAEPAKWIGLKIISHNAGLAGDTEGIVEFVARYKVNGKAHRLHETSRFVYEHEQWFYVAGK